MKKYIHGVTRLLTAFHSWAMPVSQRLYRVAQKDGDPGERLAMIEARLLQWERAKQ